MTTDLSDREAVTIDVCWGCNRQRWPKAWRGWGRVLRAERRLCYRETLCGRRDCEATVITEPARRSA